MAASAAFDVAGKVCLVTGGGRGIGLGVGRALARRGATVVLLDLDPQVVQDAAAALGPQHLGLAADVTDVAALQRVVATVVERCGGLDVVVANAGIASRGATLRAMAPENVERVLEVNLLGVERTVRAALPEVAARGGHVVVTSSVYAFVNGVGAVPYAMAKAGVEALGRALRVELARHGAGASVAYFGFIDTAMVHRAIDGDELVVRLQQLLPKPFQKRLTPDQAGEAVARGIERRAPRIIAPRRWAAYSALRGVVNPLLDRYMARSAQTQELVGVLDERGGEAQPDTL